MFRIPGGQGEAMVAGKLPGDPAQLQPVMRDADGFAGVDVDAGPDNMPGLAAVVVDMTDNTAGLPGKSKLFLDALD